MLQTSSFCARQASMTSSANFAFLAGSSGMSGLSTFWSAGKMRVYAAFHRSMGFLRANHYSAPKLRSVMNKLCIDFANIIGIDGRGTNLAERVGAGRNNQRCAVVD